MENKRKNIFKKFKGSADLPLAYVGKCAEVYMIGQNEVIIDGCESLLTYEDEIIEMIAAKKLYQICGKDFELQTYFDGKIKITGKVEKIEIDDYIV